MNIDELRRRAEGIHLIISDMDGTLFRDDKTVSPYSVDIIKQIRQKGIYFTVSTGRSYVWMDRFLDLMGIDGAMITSNGCEIVDRGTGEWLYINALSRDNAERGFDLCIAYRLNFFAETTEGWIIPNYVPDMDSFAGFYKDLELNGYSLDKLTRVSSGSQARDKTVLKLLIWVERGDEGELMNQFVSEMEGVDCIHSASNIYELVPAGANKGSAFLKMCGIMGIKPEECCAIGDFDNDLPMMRASGLSVTVANAPDYIRAEADFVGESNNNDGPARAIQALFL